MLIGELIIDFIRMVLIIQYIISSLLIAHNYFYSTLSLCYAEVSSAVDRALKFQGKVLSYM